MNTTSDVRDRARIMCNALAACMTQRIAPDAYSSDDGWMNVPGREMSVRLYGTVTAFDELCQAVQRIPTTSTSALLKAANAVFDKYTSLLAKRRMHSDAIIAHMLEGMPHLFEVLCSDASESVSGESFIDRSSTDGDADTVKANRGGAQKGICASWVLNGNCNKDECTFAHPARVRGARGGNRGRSSGGGGNGGGWANGAWGGGGWSGGGWNGGGWGGGGWSSGWNGGRSGKGKGKGKGKGGGRGGKGRGGGWW